MGTLRSLELMEQAFTDYLAGEKSLTELENTLKVALENLPSEKENTFTVRVKLENRISNAFFGMECFPDLNEAREFMSVVFRTMVDDDEETRARTVIDRWRSITNWDVVIDLLCLDRDFITFNPKELAAMLLHEVSFVIASEQPILHFYEAYLASAARMPKVYRVHNLNLPMLYGIPLAIACSPRCWLQDYDVIMEDATLAEVNYQDFLNTAIEKITKRVGTEVFAPTNYNDLNAAMDWANKNIVDIVRRKTELRDELYYIALQRNDGYFPQLCESILSQLGVRLRERYNGSVLESCGCVKFADGEISLEQYAPIFDIGQASRFESMWASAQESFLNRKTKKRVNLPNQFDIDRIQIEIEKMENQYDRLYVLDMIYQQIQNLDMFEESLMDDPASLKRWQPRLELLRNQLDQLRQQVLAKKNFDKSYKLWVKVPEGYEG